MTFLLIIIVTLNSNLCLFHYKSFVIFYCFYMIILSCRTESKLRYSKKNIMIKSSLYGFAVLRNPDAALSDGGFLWAKVWN